MTSIIRNISVDCADPWALASFWDRVLDRPLDPETSEGDGEVGVVLPDGSELLFLAVPEPKSSKNRLHLCLEPDIRRDDEVERILALGATLYDDRRAEDGTGWAVLRDLEGNEFCVLRSSAERTEGTLATDV
ncbi:glyoxalase [Arthrobacter sp. RIT-PI-e]|uniref:VOC family protein n=1 Tax=Arthrobacter sp. RIT-PI-e TaxID=1681197 RepID=UPI000676ACA9|nr:VOC family protein [Arthrobacter sp. RIT-PI-e]KNC20128.1 glyoxalase [Arthrobacter sp. RIT-PI-e]